MSQPAIAITGLGAVCAAGGCVSELRAAIERGDTGLGPLTRFEGSNSPVGEVREVPGDRSQGTVTHRLAIAAAREAVRDARIDIQPRPSRVGVVCGTTTGGIAFSEVWLLQHLQHHAPDPAGLRFHPAGTVTDGVATALGATGPRLTVSTACSSAAHAILHGVDLLRAGEVDIAVCGGADALTLITYYGFSSLKLLSDSPCRPFSADRAGLNLGEAGAFLVLERGTDAAHRHATAHAFITGGAVTCDAHHMTAPAPDGARVLAALHGALGPLPAAQIDYVNAHGTATRANDAMEAQALSTLFGETHSPPISSSKSFLGHTLGAAGAIEAVVTTLALRDGLLPPTLSTVTPAPEAPFDLVLQAGRRADLRHALSTSFAFGGNNAVLRFSREAP